MSGRMPRPLAVAAALLALLLALSPCAAWAQAAPASPPAGAEGLKPLLEALKDPATRDALIAHLEAATAGEAPPGPEEPNALDAAEELGESVLKSISAAVGGLSDEIARAARALGRLPALIERGVAELGQPAAQRRLWEGVSKIVLVLAAGFLAEFVVKRLLARPIRLIDARTGTGYLSRIVFVIFHTVLDLIPIVAFAVAAYGILPMTEPRRITQLVALTLINANMLSRAVAALGRLLFMPQSGHLRLLPMGDEAANYAYIWLRRLTVVAVYGYFVSDAARLLGLDRAVHSLMVDAIGLLFAGLLVMLILQQRQPVADWLRARSSEEKAVLGGLRARLADVWHALAVVYVLAVYVIWALGIPGGFEYLARATLLTLLVLLLSQAAGRLAEKAVERGFRLNLDLAHRYPLLEARANRYLPVLWRILRGGIAVVVVLLLLQIWGATPFDWLASEAGRGLLGRIFSVALIVAVALLVWEVATAFIERALRRQVDGPGSQRMKTLLPLAQNALRIVLVVLVALVLLSEIGVNIAPLLAGAGVVGLAIGFGAQTLVKDVITGFFLLVEDTVAVGDVVDLGGNAGVVERMTVRTVVLRNLEGSLFTLPFSEVRVVKNMGRDFSFAVMDVGIAYRENVDEVVALLREVAKGMREDPAFQALIVEDLEVLGLDAFGDSAVIVKVRLKTPPLKQWTVKREFNRRMKAAFDAAGIEIPFPHTTVYFGEDKQGRAPPLRLHSDDAPAPASGPGRPPALPPASPDPEAAEG